jgi:hypothetical protein
MNADQLVIVRAWLVKNRGIQTQDEIADAIVAAGFKMDRTRYGRYEKTLRIGPKVYGNLVKFWKTRGIEPPDLNPQPVEKPKDPMERMALALESIAADLGTLRSALAGHFGASTGALETLGAQLTAILDRRPGA